MRRIIRRDDAGIVPCENPVGRGSCAPPSGCGAVSAAAHMGAALRKAIICFVGAGFYPARPCAASSKNRRGRAAALQKIAGGAQCAEPEKILSLRTSPQAGVAIRNPLPARFRVWQRVGARCILLPFPQKRSPKPHASDSLFFMDLIEITADSSAGQRRYRRYTRRSDSGCRS